MTEQEQPRESNSKIKWWCNTLVVLTMEEAIRMSDLLLMSHLTKSRSPSPVALSSLSNLTFCQTCMASSREYLHQQADFPTILVQKAGTKICQIRHLFYLLLRTILSSIGTNQPLRLLWTTINSKVGIRLRWYNLTITKLILTHKPMPHQHSVRQMEAILISKTLRCNSKHSSHHYILLRARC